MDSIKPKVSVIIPTYNCAHLVSQAVESVLDQTYRDFELIVINDGSTDDTEQVLPSFGSKIRLITQENLGVAEARNTGIRNAYGEYIAFLDADDLWLPSKLDYQITFLESRPDVDVAYCDIYVIDEDGQVFSYMTAHHSGNIISSLLLKNIVVGSASAVVIHRRCFEKTGLFDPELEALEDWDMWLRLALHFQFGYVSHPLAKVRKQEMGRNRAAGVDGQRQALQMIYHNLLQEPEVQEQLPNSEHFIQALIHMNIGNYLLMNDESSAKLARREFLTAIRLWPVMRAAYAGLFKSLIGTQLSYRAWRLKWTLLEFFYRRSDA